MKKFLSLMIFVLCVGLTLGRTAQADEACENDCLQHGYAAKFCKERCSDDTNPIINQSSVRQIDPRCVDDCTNSGHDDTYCNKACAY